MKLPWLFMPGGTGSLRPPFLLSSQNSSSVAGTQIGGGDLRHSGSSASSGPVSITAPERMCAPTVEAFSITHTDSSGFSCLRRMAQDRPAGPAPTITTSYCMLSRSLIGPTPAGMREFSGFGAGAAIARGWRATRAPERRAREFGTCGA
jgi:hypothetical protein